MKQNLGDDRQRISLKQLNLAARLEKEELEAALSSEREKRRSAEALLEEKEGELSTFLSAAQDMRLETRKREEASEELMNIEANSNSKGNSLFSEVEDRRHIVENQLVQVFVHFYMGVTSVRPTERR